MNKNERLMITITTLFVFANAMSAVFMNVFLYAYTGSLVVMIIYTIFRNAITPFSKWFSGVLAVKKNYSLSLSLGLFGIVIQFIFVLGFNQYFGIYPNLVYLVALLSGIGEGIYYAAVGGANQVITTPNSRNKYLSYTGIFNNIANVFAPLISAFIIDHSISDMDGYLSIFKIVLVIYLVISFISFKIKATNSSSFKLSKILWDKDDEQWKYIQIATFIYGLKNSMDLVLVGILVYNATGGSGSLYGKLLSFFALLTIISYKMVSSGMKRHNRMKFYGVGAYLLASSTIILVLCPNIYGALYYGVMNAIATPIYTNPYNIILMNAIQDYSENENPIGRFVAKDVSLAISRCTGMLFILLCYVLLPESIYLMVSVLILSITPIFLYHYANNYHKKRDIQLRKSSK